MTQYDQTELEEWVKNQPPAFWRRIDLLEKAAKEIMGKYGYPNDIKGLAVAITSQQRQQLQKQASRSEHEEWLLTNAPICDQPKDPEKMDPVVRDARNILMSIVGIRSHAEKGRQESLLSSVYDLGGLSLKMALRGEPEYRALVGKKSLAGSSKGGKSRREEVKETHRKILAVAHRLKTDHPNFSKHEIARHVYTKQLVELSFRQVYRIICNNL